MTRLRRAPLAGELVALGVCYYVQYLFPSPRSARCLLLTFFPTWLADKSRNRGTGGKTSGASAPGRTR